VARQRSTKAHQGVLDAALKLFAERGIERTSMDSIAELSGVSKATIYKHWADKEALLLEVMAHAQGVCDRPQIDSGDIRRDLVAILQHKPPQKEAGDNGDMRERLMPHLVAYSAYNPKFGLAWRAMMMEPARRELRQVLSRGVANKELLPNLDYDVAVALLLGPMLYRHIFQSSDPPLHEDLASSVVDAFQSAFTIRDKPVAARKSARKAKSSSPASRTRSR
jgi:AcrR family transcriptional regulator